MATPKTNYDNHLDDSPNGFDVLAVTVDKIGRVELDDNYGGYASAVEEAFRLIGSNVDDYIVSNEDRHFKFTVGGDTYEVTVVSTRN